VGSEKTKIRISPWQRRMKLAHTKRDLRSSIRCGVARPRRLDLFNNPLYHLQLL
jgi:hypothetical protein